MRWFVCSSNNVNPRRRWGRDVIKNSKIFTEFIFLWNMSSFGDVDERIRVLPLLYCLFSVLFGHVEDANILRERESNKVQSRPLHGDKIKIITTQFKSVC